MSHLFAPATTGDKFWTILKISTSVVARVGQDAQLAFEIIEDGAKASPVSYYVFFVVGGRWAKVIRLREGSLKSCRPEWPKRTCSLYRPTHTLIGEVLVFVATRNVEASV